MTVSAKPGAVSTILSMQVSRARGHRCCNAARRDRRPERSGGRAGPGYGALARRLDAGESIRALAEYLGHADPAFTLRVYTHLMPSSSERTRRAIDEVFHRRDAA